MARATIGRTLVAAALVGVALTTSAAHGARADTLEIQAPQAAPADMPARGMSMDNVQGRFGAPNQKLSPVGTPPITRWDYPGYVVYFEYQHVIHSVVKHSVS